eukprot:1148108-Pelagomonas_calceolata.AAC.5
MSDASACPVRSILMVGVESSMPQKLVAYSEPISVELFFRSCEAAGNAIALSCCMANQRCWMHAACGQTWKLCPPFLVQYTNPSSYLNSMLPGVGCMLLVARLTSHALPGPYMGSCPGGLTFRRPARKASYYYVGTQAEILPRREDKEVLFEESHTFYGQCA